MISDIIFENIFNVYYFQAILVVGTNLNYFFLDIFFGVLHFMIIKLLFSHFSVNRLYNYY